MTKEGETMSVGSSSRRDFRKVAGDRPVGMRVSNPGLSRQNVKSVEGPSIRAQNRSVLIEMKGE